MLNKKKAQTWVKIVAWLLAASFGLSMTLLLAIPNRPVGGNAATGSASTNGADNSTLTPIKSGKTAGPAESAVGQGDLALKNGQIDQAIDFYEKAYELDKKDSVKSKLGNAYYALGRQAMPTDKVKAKDAFEKYLKLLPDGPNAGRAKAALEEL